MGKYLIGWGIFLFAIFITIKILDPEYFASQRLAQAMVNLEQAELSQDNSQQAYYYGQALSELSKLKRQFVGTEVYQRIFVADELNLGLIQAQYNRLSERPWQVAEPSYLSQALSLIETLPDYAQLAPMIALAPAIKRNSTLSHDFIARLQQGLDESSDINLQCQAYQLLAASNSSEAKHQHLAAVSQVLSQSANQQLQQTCMAAYFDVASQMSYLPDLQALSQGWQIPLEQLQLYYTKALIENGFYSLAKKQQQALAKPLQQAEMELLLLTKQWPSLAQVQRKEQALLNAGISLVNLEGDEQGKALLMQLITFLFSQNELDFAAGLRSRIKAPMDKVRYQALELNAQDRLKPNVEHLTRLPQIIASFHQNKEKLQGQLGFHEIMDIWLNEQIALSEQSVMMQVAQVLYRHHKSNPELVQPWFDELGEYPAISLAQTATDLTAASSAITSENAMALLQFISQEQAPSLVKAWLAQVTEEEKLAGLIWLANQAK